MLEGMMRPFIPPLFSVTYSDPDTLQTPGCRLLSHNGPSNVERSRMECPVGCWSTPSAHPIASTVQNIRLIGQACGRTRGRILGFLASARPDFWTCVDCPSPSNRRYPARRRLPAVESTPQLINLSVETLVSAHSIGPESHHVAK